MFFRPVDIQLQKLAQFYQIFPVFPEENTIYLCNLTKVAAKTNLAMSLIVYGV